jgi:hypothetical protein
MVRGSEGLASRFGPKYRGNIWVFLGICGKQIDTWRPLAGSMIDGYRFVNI